MSLTDDQIKQAITDLDDEWNELLQTTKSGAWFKANPNATGHWPTAKKYHDTAKALLAAGLIPPPPPSPPPGTVFGKSLYARMAESKLIDASPGDLGTITVTPGSTALSNAFKTVTPGGIIFGRQGNYPYDVLRSYTFSKDNPVTVKPFPGEQMTVIGPDASHTAYNGYELAYIQGVRFRGIDWDCPYGVNNYKLDSCSHIEFDKCVFRNAGRLRDGGGHGGLWSSYTTSPKTPNVDIQVWNSRIYDWHHNPAQLNGNHGVYCATANYCQIVNTEIWNDVMGGGYGMQLGAAFNFFIVANCTMDGITGDRGGATIWGSSTEGSATSGGQMVNCLSTNNPMWGVQGVGSPATTRSIVEHLMGFNNGSGDIYPGNMITVLNSHHADPQYVDRAKHDYHLKGGSPARGVGNIDFCPPRDKDGNLRSVVGLGAYL